MIWQSCWKSLNSPGLPSTITLSGEILRINMPRQRQKSQLSTTKTKVDTATVELQVSCITVESR